MRELLLVLLPLHFNGRLRVFDDDPSDPTLAAFLLKHLPRFTCILLIVSCSLKVMMLHFITFLPFHAARFDAHGCAPRKTRVVHLSVQLKAASSDRGEGGEKRERVLSPEESTLNWHRAIPHDLASTLIIACIQR